MTNYDPRQTEEEKRAEKIKIKESERRQKIEAKYYIDLAEAKSRGWPLPKEPKFDSKVSVTVNQDGSSIVSVDAQVPAQCQYCNYARITRGIDECMHPEENGRELEGIGGPPPSWCPLRRGFDSEDITHAINDLNMLASYEPSFGRTFSTAARWVKAGNYESAIRELNNIVENVKEPREVERVIRFIENRLSNGK